MTVRNARRDLVLAVLAAWAIIAARSAVFIVYPHAFFDSDQAIVGLMAKHLIEGRAFPLFYYGQTYLLGVEAWLAAPFFLAGGPTVAMLHAAVMSVNLSTAALLIAALVRWCGLAPFQALAASLFFVLMPPFTSALLAAAHGGQVEPFVYVLLAWLLRDRPMWLGLVLGVGVLNREFTIYAVPALLAVQLGTGTLVRADRLRAWLISAVVFLAVTQAVDALTPFADLKGPATRGRPVQGAASSTVGNVLDRTDILPRELVDRGRVMLSAYFPRQIGARRVEAPEASQGRDWLFWPTMIVLGLTFGRALERAWARRADPARPPVAFGAYLIIIGLLSAVGYVLTRPITPEPIDRYMLLVIFAPIGSVALFLALEPRAWVRRAAIALVAGWAVVSAVDHARLFDRYSSGQADADRALADGLVARGIRVAAAEYWSAYKLTFLARERVKIASTDVSRIEEYDALAQDEGERLIVLQAAPCASDLEPLAGFHLCRAGP